MDFVLLANSKGVIIVVVVRTDWIPEWTEGEHHGFGNMFQYQEMCDQLGIETQNVIGVLPIICDSDEAQEYALAELGDGVGGIEWGNEPNGVMDAPDTDTMDLLMANLEKWANRKVPKGDDDGTEG